MGRTTQSWRIIDHEFAKLNKFRHFLRAEDQMIFEALLNKCKLYVSAAGVLASSVSNSYYCSLSSSCITRESPNSKDE
jgi:hypothetical protein